MECRQVAEIDPLQATTMNKLLIYWMLSPTQLIVCQFRDCKSSLVMNETVAIGFTYASFTTLTLVLFVVGSRFVAIIA